MHFATQICSLCNSFRRKVHLLSVRSHLDTPLSLLQMNKHLIICCLIFVAVVAAKDLARDDAKSTSFFSLQLQESRVI